MSVIAVANHKGGVGKTTTVVNLAAGLRERGYRVLVVDNDPQASLALALGVRDAEELSPTLGDLLIAAASGNGKPIPDAQTAVISTPCGLDFLPCNSQLAAAELILASCMGREFILRDVLASVVDRYDFVVLDCLPGLGLLSINGLTASDAVVIPVQADYLALQGVAQVLRTIGAVRAKLNRDLRTLGVVLTMFDGRTLHAREVVALLHHGSYEDVHVFDTPVHAQVALKDSVQRAEPIMEYRPSSQAASAYRRLAHEVAAAMGREAPPEPLHRAPAGDAAAGSNVVPLVVGGLRVNAARSAPPVGA
jgi:chromosome partitioning protein